MKKIAFLFFCFPALGAGPITSCPSGYVSVTEDFMIVATSCPSDYVSVGDADSCLVSNPAGSCVLYAPAGISFVENGHTYEFDDICPLTN